MFKIAVCDDQRIDRCRLKELIQKSRLYSDNMEIVEFSTGEEFLCSFSEEFQLVFLDMQMDQLDGYHTAEAFRNRNRNAVLAFCSAVVFPQPEHFEVQPYRYLIKHSDREKIQKNIDELLEEMMRRKEQEYLEVVTDGAAARIKQSDIIYIMKVKRGCKIELAEDADRTGLEGEIITKEHLDELNRELQNSGFGRPHSSYLVNLKRIIKIEKNEIYMQGGLQISITRSCRDSFQREFSYYFSKKYKRSAEK